MIRRKKSIVRKLNITRWGLTAACFLFAAETGFATDPDFLADGSGRSILDFAIDPDSISGSHPVILDGMFEMPGGQAGDPRGGVPLPIEPQPPLANGPFVNFESPQVKPLAITPDGTTLYATNTPNNSLIVFSTTGGMSINQEIPVGLDPISVAIQPNTNNELVWVVNHLSDNVSVVDIPAGTVDDVIDVGDEPVNILFNAGGTHAFVVLQGSALPGSIADPLVEEGNLLAIDTLTHQVVNRVHLDCSTPRAAVYNPVLDQVIVAAFTSGNNTTVVGDTVVAIAAGPPPQPVAIPHLFFAANFSQTAAIFSASPELGPVWPDPPDDPSMPPSPLVHRIVHDRSGGWQAIIDILSDGAGNPDPAMVTLMNAEFAITNADVVIQAMIDDASDTIDHDLVVVDVSDPAGVGMSLINTVGNVGSILTGMGISPAGEIFVSNMETLNTTKLERDLNGHFVDHEIVIVLNPDLPNPFVHATDLHAGVPGFNDVSTPNPLAQQFSLANPLDIVFNAAGDRAYVASLGVGRIGVLDGLTASVLGRVDVGRGPRGLALDSATNSLYVMNRTDMTIMRVDVTNDNSPQVAETLPLFNPEPPAIRNGRDFLYSTRRSNNFASACAICHPDGHMDNIAWDLGDPGGTLQPAPPNLTGLSNHPVKGPMVTLSLRGLDRHEPLHWRADKPVFQDFNGAFAGLLGGSVIPSADMDAFNDFVKTINYMPNPYRFRDDTFKAPNGQAGLAQFIGPNGIPQGAANCHICHEVDHGGALFGATGDQGISLVGPPVFGQLQLVTQMRGITRKFRNDLYTGFGLIHDGREERENTNHPLKTFFATFFPAFTPAIQDALISYCEAFPTNVKPVVGWQVKPFAPVAPEDEASINLMITQHAMVPSRNDVIAKGIVAGQPRGFFLVAAEPAIIFESDLETAHTLNDLLNFINTGDSLVFSAVPPGSGQRIGIDQDLDGLGDGLDPMPQVNNDADVNLNGVADGDDIQPFLVVLFNPGAATVAEFHAADANNDDIVNFDDVTAVVTILLSGGIN
ncbi:MAG: YncE family protein [Phycisphaerae bacterium]